MSDSFVIFPTDAQWRIVSPGAIDDLRVNRETTPADIGAAVAAKLCTRGYRGEGTLVAIPSAWCLSASISTADLPRQDRAAMAFRLEEKLPLAAESFTADFIPGASGEARALGVCVPDDRVRPIIDALESAGVVVQSVTPAALLAVQSLALPPTRPRLVICGEGDHLSLITMAGGVPTAWALARAGPNDLAVHLDLAAMELDPSATAVLARAVPPELLDTLAARGFEEVDARDESAEDSVVAAAPAVLSGRLTPWVEFRRGALGVSDPLRVVRRPINAALAALAACLLVATAVFAYRALAYDRLAQSYERDLADDFKREFPGWSNVPPNVRAVVDAERRKLQAAGTSALPPEAQDSALRVLYDVLAKFPPDAKMSINKMAFHDALLEIDGHARGNEEVDALVAAARGAGMDVPPPQMRKNPADGMWDFVVRGSRPSAVAGGGRGAKVDMARRTSLLLSLLIVAAALAAVVAYARMDKLRDDAETARSNLAGARASMAQARTWRSSPGRATAATMDASQLSARLREAATAAGLADAPGSEPDNNFRRVGDSDYSEMSVYLRFEPLTLRQLTTFLHTLARIDPSSRATSIELSPPTQAGAAADLWIADVTVGYLTYAPRK